MCYWGAQTLNLGETTEPLLVFLDKLAIAGEKTARDLYQVGESNEKEGGVGNSSGGAWVAHGYVDINIDARPHGDLQVCITHIYPSIHVCIGSSEHVACHIHTQGTI